MKNQTFEKKGEISDEKNFWPIFSPIIEHENIGKQPFIRVHEFFWHLLCKWYHPFFGTLEVDRNKRFKKQLFSGDKIFGPFSP